MGDFFKRLFGGLFGQSNAPNLPGITGDGKGQGGLGQKLYDSRLGDLLFGPEKQLGRGEEALSDLRSNYEQYLSSLTGMLDQSPQIDLSGYIDQLGGLGQNILDDALRSAGMIEGAAGKGLEAALGSYDAYLSRMKDMSTQDLPGMDIYRGQIGAQSAQNIQQLKDIGGLSASTFGSVLGGQNQQLRDLALQSANYKAQRQADLANAFANYGQLAQSAYGQQAGLLGQASNIRQSGMGAQAGLVGQQAGLSQAQFQYNQMIPWQTGVNVYSNLAQQTNPYLTELSWYGDRYAIQAAQRQQMLDSITQGIGGMYNYAQEGMANLASAAIGKL